MTTTDLNLSARRPGASELLKSLGLLVDGPSLWGSPGRGSGPGVFVIELATPLADAPIDIVAVRRWLEKVPALMLDGERPTAEAVARRLHEFWLPNEPVVYVGRSANKVGARINAINATPLGDAKPYAGAHWLRTLSVQNDLRIWWAGTDAHEEYEDALLGAIAERNANAVLTPDGTLLPFANLATADGTPKAHGLTNSLATDGATGPTKSTARGSRTTTTGARAATRGRAATTASRKAPAPKAPPPRPTIAPTLVSQEGLDNLNAELENLRTIQRPEIIARVATARSHGDLKENAEYEYARKEQSFIEGRIQTIEQMIRHAEVIDHNQPSDSVHVGSTVEVESDGERDIYVIVGSTEANPALGRLSNASPVGRALLGARVGDDVRVELPAGSVTYRVIEVR